MSGLSRRALLGGAVAMAGAAGMVGVRRWRAAGRAPRIIVFDSRKPASLAFAQARPVARRIDLAKADASWRAIRGLKDRGAVAGLTGWNDYVFARQWLEERGLRVVEQSHDRWRELIAWTMA